MPLDYFVWLIRGDGREIVVDTGFSEAMARKRGRDHIRCPTMPSGLLGCDATKVKDVVITHLHYDHVGNLRLFPAATLHLQDLEMRYATGRYMGHNCFRGAYEVEDVVGMVRRVYADRVRFHDGEAEIAPGVRAPDRRPHDGTAVGAREDAARLGGARVGREPLLRQHGAGAAVSDRLVGGRHGRGLSQAERAGRISAHIIPGHDPLVFERYPAPSKELKGIVVRLD